MMRLAVESVSEEDMFATHVTATGARIETDEPVEVGGRGVGANPLEAVLAAWAGCLIVVARMVAKERGLTPANLYVHVDGEFDPRGFMGAPNVRTYFSQATANLQIEGISEADCIPIVAAVEARCPVSGLLHSAGVVTRIDVHSR